MLPTLLLFASMGTFIRDASGRVTEADMRLTWIDDSDLQDLGRMATLERIDLSHTRVTDLGFGALKALRGVRELDLSYAEQTGDGALAALKDWKHLRKLNLRGTKVTDAGLIHLAALNELEDLDIGFALITDGAFDRLTPLTGLKSLSIGGNKITGAGLTGLLLLPQLTHLDVSGKQRTDSGLWFASITDEALETVGALTRLEFLNLTGTSITDAGLTKLMPLKGLHELHLAHTQVSSAGLVNLRQLPNLQRLGLTEDARVDDTAVAALASFPHLTWLDLEGTHVSAAGVARLRAALPKCRILSGAQP